MRLNIRQFLALPLALGVAYVVVAPLTHRCISYSWGQADCDIRMIENEIESRFLYHRAYSVAKLSRWMNGNVRQDDPRELQWASSPGSDPWGNAYRIVEFESPASDKQRFGIYSLGRDGKSTTDGNDQDDIRSWTDDPLGFYQLEAYWDRTCERLIATMLATPIVYAPLFFLTRTRRRKPTEPSDGRGADSPLTDG